MKDECGHIIKIEYGQSYCPLCGIIRGAPMAEILEHPDKEMLTDEKEFKFAEGSVLLKTSDGRPLDLKMSIWLLESVRHYIMKISFEE